MLQIVIPAEEFFDDEKEEFVYTKETVLQLEHSLVSISKWESHWQKPFLSGDKTIEETIDYIRMMTITKNVNHEIFNRIPSSVLDIIRNYIDSPMTATTIYDTSSSGNKEIITSELIYYWMISLNIPVEFQKWHINRLLTLIRVCNIKNQPPKKVGKNEIMSRNAALNKARRERLNSNG